MPARVRPHPTPREIVAGRLSKVELEGLTEETLMRLIGLALTLLYLDRPSLTFHDTALRFVSDTREIKELMPSGLLATVSLSLSSSGQLKTLISISKASTSTTEKVEEASDPFDGMGDFQLKLPDLK